ncbi:MAG: glycoside hydrolase family 2 protein [Acidimicrobiales bacterium]
MGPLSREGSDAVGNWRAIRATERLQRRFTDPAFDDSDWLPVEVPAHWQTQEGFEDFDGTLLYRADMIVPSLQPTQRRWLRFEGVCYTSDVFLDGVYLGETEGYFTHHQFEITDLVAEAGSAVLAVEVGAPHNTPDEPKRTLTGWFTDAPGRPAGWTPAGIWRPVNIVDTGPIAFRHLRVICEHANASRADLALRAVILSHEATDIELVTDVDGETHTTTQTVAAGENQVEWHVEVDEPELWWPHGHGDQPLYDLRVQARTADGVISDRKHRRIGLRSTSMSDFVLRVNGARVFAKGINVAPTALDLARVPVAQIQHEVEAIRDAGFNLVRVRSHVTRGEFYDACDEAGLLVWQDMPLSGSYARNITDRATEQAREMVDLLGHHPSIVVWGGHMRPHTNEPRSSAIPNLRQQQVPSWNRTVLDRAIRRTLTGNDPSRKVVAHSEVAPHIPHLSGSDLGLYFGWFDGQAADLAEYAATLPRFVRFVSDMGAQALPVDLDRSLDELLDAHGSEPEALRAMVPAAGSADAAEWVAHTRSYQAEVLKTTLETLRVLKYTPTGGFCAGLWRALGPGLSRSLVDAAGTSRPALDVARNALAPVLPVLYPPLPSVHARSTTMFALHLCNDEPRPHETTVRATISDGRGTRTRAFTGMIAADDVAHLGDVAILGGRIGDVATIVLRATGDGFETENEYQFMAT